MKNPAARFGRRLWAALASLLLVLGLLWPIRSEGAMSYSNSGGDCEGDPIDGNDYGTDGGGATDDNIHADPLSVEPGVFRLPSFTDGASILLVPDFQSGLVIFRIFIITEPGSQAEGFDAP